VLVIPASDFNNVEFTAAFSNSYNNKLYVGSNREERVKTQANEIWGTHGGHGVTYNPYQGIRRTGLSHFKNEEWNNISYDSLTSIMPNPL